MLEIVGCESVDLLNPVSKSVTFPTCIMVEFNYSCWLRLSFFADRTPKSLYFTVYISQGLHPHFETE